MVVCALGRASAALDAVCRTAASAALVLLVGTIALQVVARYAMRSPFPWTEELARYLMVWGGLLGATCAFKAGADPRIVQPDALRAAWLRRLAAAVAGAASLVLFAPVLWYSFVGPGGNVERGFLYRNMMRTSDGLEISMALVAAAIPTAAAVMIVHVLAALAAGLAGGRRG